MQRRLSVLAGALVAATAAPLGAQRARFTIEPQVHALPAADLWGRTSVVSTVTTSSAYPGQPQLTTRSTRTTEIDRTALTLVGARLTFAPASSGWRFVLDGATGRTRLNAHVAETYVAVVSDGPFPALSEYRTWQQQPLRLTQLALRAGRDARLGDLALEVNAGALAQHVRARQLFVGLTGPTDPPTYPGGLHPVTRRRSYVDPGASVGLALGPAAGWFSGARLSLRSTHVWRGPAMANGYRILQNREADLKSRDWQWQPEIALGWRLAAR